LSKTLSLCYSLKVRDQVSHPYGTTGKITVLYILILEPWWISRYSAGPQAGRSGF
jgi:hypothetical protein